MIQTPRWAFAFKIPHHRERRLAEEPRAESDMSAASNLLKKQ